ncbi:MmgE/PrpD family protein [Delftia sp. Cs1-4]|uniref:MmgE/PrpD family protein n=1 Tax=Delftia sp. (strain Cs1-4) TaxID=742013 RepID=UPI00020E7D23|nr:MmgE/PrpD family protein [Delftia sp. Cs1-4]AEF88667.1 MmgE/PrpD family protein [Delftia sp. Cs1-4]
MSSDQPTALLGRFASETAGKPLEARVAEKAAFCLLDGIGLALAGAAERTAAAVRTLVTPAAEGATAATVWADGARVGLADAVLANAVSVHAQFHDDSDNDSWSHPGCFILPVAVALAEQQDQPVERLLRSIAIGYAATAWLGAKERVARALIERGIRTSPTLGTIGAAAAAAAALGLDVKRAANAIGIAAGITGGVLEPVGSGADDWRIQVGQAARGGLLAAQLARMDVLGSPQGLEGRHGLSRALAGLQETPPEWLAPPDPALILGICAKPFATLGDNMSVVLAAKVLHEAGVDHRRIRKATVKVWRHYAEYPGTSYGGPFERTVQALASMRFSTAAMLAYGELEYDKPQDHRQDADILRLVQLIEIVPDDDGNPYDAELALELDDGSRRVGTAAQAPRTLLFHDRATAAALLERRLSAGGRQAGAGTRAAQDLFAAIDGGTPLGCREFLRRFI